MQGLLLFVGEWRADGKPSHRETGFIRGLAGSVAFSNDPRMLGSRRLLTVSAERLRYELSMTTTATPDADLLPHLVADMTRLQTSDP